MVFKALSGGVSGDLGNSTDLYGYFADTVLVLDNSNYTIATYEGNDTIDTSRPAVTGSSTAYCGSGNDRFIGGGGGDTLLDGSGNDTGSMGAGIDNYVASTGNDKIDGGADSDFVYFIYGTVDFPGLSPKNTVGVVFDLNKTTTQNLGAFGQDIITGFENVFGGYGSDKLYGTAGANNMQALDGNDIVDGRAGNDNIGGGEGRDTLTGGTGADSIDVTELTAVRDIIIYKTEKDSGTTVAKRDSISHFDAGSAATDDRISLKAIDADATTAGDQAFIFRGSAAYSSTAGEVRVTESGGDTIVHIDLDGDAADEMTIFLGAATGLTAADFIL